jgi:hypothetical protein
VPVLTWTLQEAEVDTDVDDSEGQGSEDGSSGDGLISGGISLGTEVSVSICWQLACHFPYVGWYFG